MKKIKGIAAWGILLIFVVLIIAALVLPTFGRRITGTTEDIIGTYAGVGSGQSDNVKASLDLAHTDLDALIATGVDVQGLLGLGGVGVVWYVDSTATGTDAGTSWTNACPTLEEAIVLALAGTGDDGDIILVAAGHAETLTAADDVDFDVAGVKAIGCGVGENRPTFTYTTNGEVVIGADDVEIHNMNFIAGNAVAHAIDVETGSENWIINNCRFAVTTLDTDEFTDCITTTADSDNGRITNCRFEMGAASADAAIQNVGCDFVEISNNIFTGDYATACIEDKTTASIWMVIKDNVLVNGTGGTFGLNAVACISLKSDSTAIIVGNKLFCDVATPEASIVAADGLLSGNTYSENESTAGSVPIGLNTGAPGSQLVIVVDVNSSLIPSNTQTAGAITGAASGTLVLENICISTDATGFAGPTNIEISTDNTYGATGAAAPLVLEAVAGLGANISWVIGDATSSELPTQIEDGKKLFIHGDDGAGTGDKHQKVILFFRRITAGATIAANDGPS